MPGPAGLIRFHHVDLCGNPEKEPGTEEVVKLSALEFQLFDIFIRNTAAPAKTLSREDCL